METVELTLSIEKIKLDALTYALSEHGGDTPQRELEKRFTALYEELVAPELRGYIEYMIDAQRPRSHARKTSRERRSASAPTVQEEHETAQPVTEDS